MKREPKPLTAKQKQFLSAYIKCLNAKEAALQAGYSDRIALKVGNQLLNKPEIVKEMNRRLKSSANGLNVGKSYVVKKLLEIVEFSLSEEDITDKDGQSTGRRKLRDASGGIKALESLCKHLDMVSELNAEKVLGNTITFIENLNDKKL